MPRWRSTSRRHSRASREHADGCVAVSRWDWSSRCPRQRARLKLPRRCRHRQPRPCRPRSCRRRPPRRPVRSPSSRPMRRRPVPTDILEAAFSGVECGYLTVLEDRSRPSGRTLRLFASRSDPPGEPAVDPGFGGTEELGINTPPGDDNSAGAQRLHRFAYKLDPRGLDLSDANLDCPEVSAVGPELVGLRLRDPEHRRVLLAAVSACRDRLLGQGIDLTAYDVAANVADLEDFRRALDIPLVNVGSNVNGSRVVETYVRTYPGVVRTLIMDSPALATPDVLTIGPAALDLAIERLSAACADQPACRSRMPDLSRGDSRGHGEARRHAGHDRCRRDPRGDSPRAPDSGRHRRRGVPPLCPAHTRGLRWRALRRGRPHHRAGPRWNARAGRYDRDDARVRPWRLSRPLAGCDAQ